MEGGGEALFNGTSAPERSYCAKKVNCKLQCRSGKKDQKLSARARARACVCVCVGGGGG